MRGCGSGGPEEVPIDCPQSCGELCAGRRAGWGLGDRLGLGEMVRKIRVPEARAERPTLHQISGVAE